MFPFVPCYCYITFMKTYLVAQVNQLVSVKHVLQQGRRHWGEGRGGYIGYIVVNLSTASKRIYKFSCISINIFLWLYCLQNAKTSELPGGSPPGPMAAPRPFAFWLCTPFQKTWLRPCIWQSLWASNQVLSWATSVLNRPSSPYAINIIHS